MITSEAAYGLIIYGRLPVVESVALATAYLSARLAGLASRLALSGLTRGFI